MKGRKGCKKKKKTEDSLNARYKRNWKSLDVHHMKKGGEDLIVEIHGLNIEHP